ncbi:hypothetical protein JCM33374_g3767 [Metschnikowia sp. JCM 33374]|nr:hypothetical protein JCM33374_g3767 [Metschnikowia sp. JCM 33374]
MDIRHRQKTKTSQYGVGTSSSDSSQSTEAQGSKLGIHGTGHHDEKNKSFPTKSDFSVTRLFSIRLFLALALYWLLATYVVERVRVKNAFDACQWEKWEHWTGDRASVTPHRIAFIADPQLVDDHTYPKLPRVLNYLIRRMSDNYLYINYKYLQENLDPHTTIFIGDLFDGGRDWDDEPWLEEFRRFNHIFPENSKRQSYRGLPGNHDIGFQNVSPAIAKRFATYFGEPNAAYVLGNHTIVQLDTISLSHGDPQVNRDAKKFLEEAKTSLDPSFPRIVLSHVPFYRDPKVEKCGPGRESKNPFPLMRGVEYQTVIDFPFAEDILKSLKPVLVFSGDDHDYCDMTHLDYSDNNQKLAREISCKTISMTNGIKYPAVQLLSLNNPQDVGDTGEKTYETTMCYLPSPYLGVKVYFASLVATFVVLYFWIMHPRKITELSNRISKSKTSNGPALFSLGLSSWEKRLAFAVHSGGILVLVLFLVSSYNKM